MEALGIIFQLLSSDLFLKLAILPGLAFILLFATFLPWLERKLLARVMLRIGPLHVGRYAGSLQIIADFIKLLSKEIVVPRKADRLLFLGAPILAVVTAALPLAVVPFSPTWVVFPHELSLLFAWSIMALWPIVVLIAGWSSNSKYSFIGGIRSAFQVFVYEIPVICSFLSVAVIARSLNLVEIVEAQSTVWFALLLPMAFLVFLVSALAELERTPFDIPEAEQEIVVGYLTEYTGVCYGLFMFAQYVRLIVCSLLMALLFFGGWSGPGLHPVAWMLIKMLAVVTLIILLRGAYPRVRIDQLLRLSWRVLIPLAIANLAIAIPVARMLA